jgi:hypothetical protein
MDNINLAKSCMGPIDKGEAEVPGMNGDGASYTYLSLMTGITGPFLHHDYLFSSDMQVRLDWRKKEVG